MTEKGNILIYYIQHTRIKQKAWVLYKQIPFKYWILFLKNDVKYCLILYLQENSNEIRIIKVGNLLKLFLLNSNCLF